MIIPLSGFLMSCLGFARVPYQKWLKFAVPLALIWFVIGIAAMFVGISIGYC